MQKKRVKSVVSQQTEKLGARRVLAYLIDAVIVAVVISMPFQGTWFSFSMTTVLLGGIAGMLTILYWSVLEYFTGQSIGKMIMGIRVEGEKHFWRFFIRNVAKISTLLLLIDSWNVLFRKQHQRWSEQWTDTRVIRA